MKLTPDFYQGENTLQIAAALLGKYLYTNIDNKLTGGMIVETEAYLGPEDRGSHSWNNKRTPRNEMMFAAGGVAYMYICYGMHNMLNFVTGAEGSSHAVLIRALEPTRGIEIMRERRGIFNSDKRLCAGPGALCMALGLTKAHNGTSLLGDQIWVRDEGLVLTDEEITRTARVGMNFGGPFKEIPWRFYITGSKFVSRR